MVSDWRYGVRAQFPILLSTKRVKRSKLQKRQSASNTGIKQVRNQKTFHKIKKSFFRVKEQNDFLQKSNNKLKLR